MYSAFLRHAIKGCGPRADRQQALYQAQILLSFPRTLWQSVFGAATHGTGA
jgi:hypothetical protein